MKRHFRRIALARLLADLCRLTLTLIDPRDGWPAKGVVALAEEDCPVSCYVGQIGLSHRGRDHVERRLQNPGKNKPGLATDGDLPLLLGLWTEGEGPVLVGMDARRHLAAVTRKSLFVPLRSLEQAAVDGWAEHVSASGERIVCFTPDRLPDYVTVRLKELRGGASGSRKERS